jgi:hypothetical protein
VRPYTAKSKIESRNTEYMRPNTSHVRILDDPLHVDARPQIDSHNLDYQGPTGGNVKVLVELFIR